MNYNSSYVVLAIVLLLTSSIVIIASDSIPLAQGKKSASSHRNSTTKGSKPGAFVPGTTGGGFAEEPPIGTEPLTPAVC